APLEHDDAERRHGKVEQTEPAVPGDRFGVGNAAVAQAAAAVALGVAVEDFVPATAVRGADAIMVARHWGEVEGDDDLVVRITAVARERDDALLVVVGVD